MTTKLIEALRHGSFSNLKEAKALEPLPDGRKRWDVVILSEGKGNLKDKHIYSQACIDAPVTSKAFEGKPCYLNHPDAISEQSIPERRVEEQAGYFSNVRPEGNALKATLTQKTTEAGRFLAEHIQDCLDFAKEFPGENLSGISINASGETKPVKMGTETWKQVDAITEAVSADAVTLPARGGMFLKQLEAVRKTKESAAMTGVKTILEAIREKVLAGVEGKDIKRMIDNAITACEGNIPESGRESMTTEEKKLKEAANLAFNGLVTFHEAEAKKAEEAEDEAKKKEHEAEAEKYKAMQTEGENPFADDSKDAKDKKKAEEAKKKKEAEDEAKKKEAEDESKKKKESMSVQTQLEESRKENFELKLGIKLQESGLPEVFHKRVKLMAVGKTDAEVDSIIESAAEEHDFTLKESGISVPTRRGSTGDGGGSLKESHSILAKRGI